MNLPYWMIMNVELYYEIELSIEWYLRNGKSCHYGWSWRYRRLQEPG